MGNPSVQNKPTAAFVLSLVGAILAMVVAVVFLIIGIVAGIAASSSYYYYDYTGAYLFAGLGIWFLVSSIIVIVAAAKLNSDPLEHTKWGVIILVFSILGGGILGIIGGILALTFKPKTARYLPPPPLASATATRTCPQCGRAVDENAQFCMNCGRRLF